MTISQAVLFVRKPGSSMRRAAWRPDLTLRANYIGVHLTTDDTKPYPLSIDDLVADDWQVQVSSPERTLLCG
jgi:hypothetical protein